MAPPERYTISQIAEALRKSGGNITLAAAWLRKAGDNECHRNTIVRYCQRYPELNDLIEEAREELIDLAEAGLRDHVRNKDRLSIFYVLNSRRAAQRGHGTVSRHEVTGKDGGPLRTARLDDLSDAELNALEQIAARVSGSESDPGGEDEA